MFSALWLSICKTSWERSFSCWFTCCSSVLDSLFSQASIRDIGDVALIWVSGFCHWRSPLSIFLRCSLCFMIQLYFFFFKTLVICCFFNVQHVGHLASWIYLWNKEILCFCRCVSFLRRLSISLSLVLLIMFDAGSGSGQIKELSAKLGV